MVGLMNPGLKWFLYAFAAIAIGIVCLLIVARVIVGPVSLTLGEGSVDSSKLATRITVPEGFSMGVYAANIPKARILRFTRAGDLLVAVPNEDRIVLLERDANGDGKADGARVLMRGLNGPNGLDFFEDYLYIAETDAIGRIRFDHEAGETISVYERIIEGLPGGGNHWKKTLRFGPDGMMYVTMGSSCNVCLEDDERRAAMVTYNPDGSGESIFARGLRNSAGFDWRPADGEIYATDNGRDALGDDFPPCELNLVQEGNHYGWPFANGDKVPDPDFGQGHDAEIEDSVAPVHGFRAHNAPLGIEFVKGDAFPEEYRGAAIVALHGSWNRSEKDGYKVVSIHWDDEGDVTERDFVAGFLHDGEVIGRPAEVTEGPDGAFYIADDYAGAVYRVAYGEEQTLEIPPITLKEYDREETLGALAPEERERLAEIGSKIFRQDPCLTCHGDAAINHIPLEDIGGKYNIQTLSEMFKRPTPPMPLFPYTDDDRRALSVYLIENY
jgi:glucose/arabinose dehydrogenase